MCLHFLLFREGDCFCSQSVERFHRKIGITWMLSVWTKKNFNLFLHSRLGCVVVTFPNYTYVRSPLIRSDDKILNVPVPLHPYTTHMPEKFSTRTLINYYPSIWTSHRSERWRVFRVYCLMFSHPLVSLMSSAAEISLSIENNKQSSWETLQYVEKHDEQRQKINKSTKSLFVLFVFGDVPFVLYTNRNFPSAITLADVYVGTKTNDTIALWASVCEEQIFSRSIFFSKC